MLVELIMIHEVPTYSVLPLQLVPRHVGPEAKSTNRSKCPVPLHIEIKFDHDFVYSSSVRTDGWGQALPMCSHHAQA